MIQRYFTQYPQLIAGISDNEMSFMPADFDVPLSMEHQQYLKKQLNKDISQVFWRKQVHGDAVLIAKDSPATCAGQIDADAYITKDKNLPIAIRTADCVPVFLFDPIKKAIGVVHAGWQGTVVRINNKTVQRMAQEFGCNPKDIQAVIGPSALPCCYNVGEEFQKHFPKTLQERDGKLYANVALENKMQLLEAGVMEKNITHDAKCTICDHHYFSFRRQGDQSGRMISMMMLV